MSEGGDTMGGIGYIVVSFYYAMIIALIVMEIILGVACREMMRVKGSANYNIWFLAGLLLSVIGVIITILMPDQNPSEPVPTSFPQAAQYQPPAPPLVLDEQTAETCPHCLALTPGGSKFCIKCGCKLN